jgi:hypothetical protein
MYQTTLLIMKMEAICSSEKSVSIYQAARHHIPKADTPRSNRCENLEHGTNCSAGGSGDDSAGHVSNLGSRNVQFKSRPGGRLP